MAVQILTRSRAFAVGLVGATLAFAACGHHTPTVQATAAPKNTPTPIYTAGPTSSPCIISLGLTYEPDGGNGAGFNGIQVTHYEGNEQYLCSAGGPTASPVAVNFSSSVGAFAIDDDNADAAALLANSSGAYSLVQDVFGATVGSIVPAGSPYDVSLQPPTPTPSPGATAGVVEPVIPAAGNVSIVGSGEYGVAIVTGVGASPPAVVALTSLENAPPQFGQSVLYNYPTYTDPSAPYYPRSIVRIAPATTGDGTAAFARGTSDLLEFAVKDVGAPPTGYQFNVTAEDNTLGSNVALRGNGNIGFDPADGTKALIGGTTSGQNLLTLLTGLPDAMTHTSALTMPGTINSISISANGESALVGTSVGVVVVTGIATNSLSLVAPFAVSPLSVSASSLTYTNCMGTTSQMTTIYSIGYSPGYVPGSTVNQYLVALGQAPGVVCPSGRNASLVALAFDPATGLPPVPTPTPTVSPSPSPSPAGATAAPTASPTPPARFVQNNIIAPPTGADILVVR